MTNKPATVSLPKCNIYFSEDKAIIRIPQTRIDPPQLIEEFSKWKLEHQAHSNTGSVFYYTPRPYIKRHGKRERLATQLLRYLTVMYDL